MEKKQNGYYKAVSIISLVVAILSSIILCFTIVGSIFDLNGLILEFISYAYEESVGVPGEITGEVKNFTIVMIVTTCIYIACYAAVHYLAYVKLKKYSRLTDEEAKNLNGKLVAWTVIMFLFSGIINGVLMLCGYTSVTKEQIENFDNSQNSVSQNTVTNQAKQENNMESIDTKDLDAMIERLERLNKIKQMGGLTDEEYENLRKKIVDNKN